MKKSVKRIEDLLHSPVASEFVAVTIPEDMAILETERLITGLGRHGIKVRQLIINNVLQSDGCEFCREKMKSQHEHIIRIEEKFKGLTTTIVPLQPREVKGKDALTNFKQLLFN